MLAERRRTPASIHKGSETRSQAPVSRCGSTSAAGDGKTRRSRAAPATAAAVTAITWRAIASALPKGRPGSQNSSAAMAAVSTGRMTPSGAWASTTRRHPISRASKRRSVAITGNAAHPIRKVRTREAPNRASPSPAATAATIAIPPTIASTTHWLHWTMPFRWPQSARAR